jgi:hypothetical protein
MLSGKLCEFSPSHVCIYSSISQVNFTAVRTLSQIGEIWSMWWRAISLIFFTDLPTYGRGLRVTLITNVGTRYVTTLLQSNVCTYVYSTHMYIVLEYGLFHNEKTYIIIEVT